MKIVGIFNQKEAVVGFRLSGIETNFIQDKVELSKFLKELKQDTDIGILVINLDIYNLLPEEFDKIEQAQLPLLLKLK